MELLPAGPEPEAIKGELILGPKNSALYAAEQSTAPPFYSWQWGTTGATFTFTTDTSHTRF